MKSRGPRCYQCKKLEHVRRDCPQRKNGKEKKGLDGKTNANIVQKSSDEGELEGSDVLNISTSSSLDTWVMDTSASYHITFNKHWFHSFK